MTTTVGIPRATSSACGTGLALLPPCVLGAQHLGDDLGRSPKRVASSIPLVKLTTGIDGAASERNRASGVARRWMVGITLTHRSAAATASAGSVTNFDTWGNRHTRQIANILPIVTQLRCSMLRRVHSRSGTWCSEDRARMRAAAVPRGTVAEHGNRRWHTDPRQASALVSTPYRSLARRMTIRGGFVQSAIDGCR